MAILEKEQTPSFLFLYRHNVFMKSFKKLGLSSVAMTTFPYQHPQHPSQPVAAKNSFLFKPPSEDTELYKLILANEKALSSKAGPKLFVTRFLFWFGFFFFFLVLRRKTESMWTVTDALYYGIPWRLEDYSWLPKLSLPHRMLMRMISAWLLMSLVG